MAERLECAQCGARAVEDAVRCPACGSRRLLAPRDVFTRPVVVGGALLLAGAVVLATTLLALTVPLGFLTRNGYSLPGELSRRTRSLDRQLDLIREAERTLPVYPGASRVGEVHGTTPGGEARTLATCWSAPAGTDFETVHRFYLDHLTAPGTPWRPLGGSARVFRIGRVYLAITPGTPGTAGESSRPPCAGTYQLSFSYQI
jgi:DNA-directed RNA polymerase subunit RPC12/RpoP